MTTSNNNRSAALTAADILKASGVPLRPTDPSPDGVIPATPVRIAVRRQDTVCWCAMCGFNAIVRPEHRSMFTDGRGHQIDCQDCESTGMLSFLDFGDELPDFIDPDEPMEEYVPAQPSERK